MKRVEAVRDYLHDYKGAHHCTICALTNAQYALQACLVEKQAGPLLRAASRCDARIREPSRWQSLMWTGKAGQ